MKPDVFPAQGWRSSSLEQGIQPGKQGTQGGKAMEYTFSDCIRYALIFSAGLLVALVVFGFAM